MLSAEKQDSSGQSHMHVGLSRHFRPGGWFWKAAHDSTVTPVHLTRPFPNAKGLFFEIFMVLKLKVIQFLSLMSYAD